MTITSRSVHMMDVEEKREKIASNYDTIQVLKERLDKSRQSQKKANMNRAAYVKMIFDITDKVDRQNRELRKVIVETRQVQKDISNLSGRLERSFSMVEESFLREARSDPWSHECLRILNTIHRNCDELIQAVRDTGDAVREMRQLEDQLAQAATMAGLPQQQPPQPPS